MRRAVAIFALLATAWPHAVVLECALGSALSPADHVGHGSLAAAERGEVGGTAEHDPARGAAHHGAAHHGLHGAHHATDPGLGAASQGDDDAPAGGASCAMVMACGLVMIQSADGPSPAAAASTPDPDLTPSLDTPSATDLTADPPPPRRHA